MVGYSKFHSQSFFNIDNAVIMRKVIPAQNRLPVKNQTTSARSTAGMSAMSKRMSSMIIIPIMTSTARATMSIWGIDSKKPKAVKTTARSSSTTKPPQKNSCR
jgi:hypothetical protein